MICHVYVWYYRSLRSDVYEMGGSVTPPSSPHTAYPASGSSRYVSSKELVREAGNEYMMNVKLVAWIGVCVFAALIISKLLSSV